MTMKKFAIACLALVSLMFLSAPVWAADASMDEVYKAAKAGRLDEAQSMMDQVLRDHPKSAKAHYVQAELYAKRGLFSDAQTELSTAERLKPDLSFATSQSVQELRNQIEAANKAATRRAAQPVSIAPSETRPVTMTTPKESSGGFSWVKWFLILLGIGILYRIFRPRPKVVTVGGGGGFVNGGGGGYVNNGQAPVVYGGGGGAVPMGNSGSGIGSGIVGGLATGAAVGVGMVAAESIAHRIFEGDGSSRSSDHNYDRGNDDNGANQSAAPINTDMGGNDFGIKDNSSWDDGSSGGSSDSGDSSWDDSSPSTSDSSSSDDWN